MLSMWEGSRDFLLRYSPYNPLRNICNMTVELELKYLLDNISNWFFKM